MNFLINLQCSQRRKWQQNTDGYPECHLNAAANAAEDVAEPEGHRYPFCVCIDCPSAWVSVTHAACSANHHALKGGFVFCVFGR